MSAATAGAMPYIAVPLAGGGHPVLIIHSWWGLTGSFTKFADKLAGHGFLAGCVDLYGGATATTEAEARRLRGQKRADPTHKTLRVCLDRLATDSRSAGGRASVVGFSVGAHWAVWLAQHPEPAPAASVLFYGARGGDWSAAEVPVLAHFAESDRFVSVAARTSMERAIGRAGVDYRAFSYPGTTHWFAEAGTASFDAAAAELAFDRTVEFLVDSAAT